MDTALVLLGWVMTVLAALVALTGGVAAALKLVAPKTKTDVDDKLAAKAEWLVNGLKWLDDKLLKLLGVVVGKVQRPSAK